MPRAVPRLAGVLGAGLVFALLLASRVGQADVASALGELPNAAALRAAWEQGLVDEQEQRLEAAYRRFEAVSLLFPEHPEPFWRMARTRWRIGERLPVEDIEGRLHHFEAAESLARRGAAVDPGCAECLFWQAAALGRITTTQGVIQAARNAPVIAELLARAIALAPTHRDSDDNTTLGNLYHASASFYRIVPDWRWLAWLVGVRGDKQRSVDYSRKAVAISPRRLDYHVELGAGLLCLGTARGRPELVEEGRAVLRRSRALAPYAETRRDQYYAGILAEQPERACSYARDGWIEIDEKSVRKGIGDVAGAGG